MKSFIDIVLAVREKANKDLGLSGDFVDCCDILCERCQKEFSLYGIQGTIVSGIAHPLWDRSIEIPHHWIKIGDFIIDPTADQLNIHSFVFSNSSDFSQNYRELEIVREF